MDVDTPTTNGDVDPGVSVRMGPVEDSKTGAPTTNGVNGKRKSTNGRKSYKEESDSDDDVPLVRYIKRRSSVWLHSDLD